MSYRLNPRGLQLVSYFVRSLIFSLWILPNPHAASSVSEPRFSRAEWAVFLRPPRNLTEKWWGPKGMPLHRGLEPRGAASRGPV